MNFFKKNGAGLLLCLLIAIPSWLLGKAVPVVGGPVFSILIGMIVTLILTDKTVFSPGINFTSKKILQTAVVFLGFGMNLTEILAKGKQSLPIILSTITTSIPTVQFWSVSVHLSAEEVPLQLLHRSSELMMKRLPSLSPLFSCSTSLPPSSFLHSELPLV